MKKLFLVLPIAALLAPGCGTSRQVSNQIVLPQNNTTTTSPTAKTGWTSYNNQDINISFDYPSTYKIYQQDARHLSMNSDYIDPKYPTIRTIQMEISQVSITPETTAQVEARFLPNILPNMSSDLKFKLNI